MRNYFILINPTAGKRNNSQKIEEIKLFFEQSGASYSLFETTYEQRADALIRNHFTESFTHLIVAGGDGTLNEAVNGLKHFDRPVGIIPMGSGNDFVKNLTLSDTYDYLLGNETIEVSVGKYNDRRFINGIGAGFDGQIVLNMSKNTTLLKGHSAYLYHVIKILGSYKERVVDYTLDGKQYSDKLLLILAANGTTFGGGFKLAPSADVTSDELDICIIKKVNPLRRFLNLNRLKKGKHSNLPEVCFFKARRITVDASNLHGQVDGEYAGTPPYSIELDPEKLSILVSKP